MIPRVGEKLKWHMDWEIALTRSEEKGEKNGEKSFQKCREKPLSNKMTAKQKNGMLLRNLNICFSLMANNCKYADDTLKYDILSVLKRIKKEKEFTKCKRANVS